MGRDPFIGYPEKPYSQQYYQYAYSNPVNWTDPTGRCVGYLWGDPSCTFIGWDHVQQLELNWQDAKPWGGAAADLTPIVGDAKGLLEVFTGCDLLTGEDLGWFRYAGLIPIIGPRARAALRGLRTADTALESTRFLKAAYESQSDDVVCYACFFEALGALPEFMATVKTMPPHKVIPLLEEAGFQATTALQPGDVVVWLARDTAPIPELGDDLGPAVAHIAIYVGDFHPGDRLLLSGNWPNGAPPRLYHWSDIGSAISNDSSLSGLRQVYYRLRN
jgi:hypothetical protein